MKKSIVILLISLNILTLTLSCDNCDTSSPPPTAPIRFAIVNKLGNNLVTGNTSKFHPDSIMLLEADQKTNTIFQKDFNKSLQGFWYQADCLKNDKGSSTLYLKLNSVDMDTLLVSYETIKSECYTYHQYTHFLHNGVEIYPSGETSALLIIK